jgi:hypothetical protein
VDCCGCLIVVERGDQADLTCNECGAVIRTVPTDKARQPSQRWNRPKFVAPPTRIVEPRTCSPDSRRSKRSSARSAGRALWSTAPFIRDREFSLRSAGRRDNGVLVAQTNFDPSNNLYWYRRLTYHPDSAVGSLAEAFCARVASWLGSEQPPTVFWSEEADFREASQAWLASSSRGNPQTNDPLQEPCEYFRWHGEPGNGFAGYTHQESPLGIMVNVRYRGKKLLEIIAEECFHFYQDTIHGTGWRAKTGEHIIESEAGAFVQSKGVEIQAFLEHYGTAEKSS